VAERLPGLLTGAEREGYEAAVAALLERGAPDGLARRVAGFGSLYAALDLAIVAEEAGEDVAAVAEVYFGLGDRLELVWLLDRVNALPRDNRWQTLARAALRDDLYAQHRALTAAILAATDASRSADERLDAWIEANDEPVGRFRQVLADVRASGVFDLATLSVAVREVAACAAAGPG
jgi:glutamate dehydrogenase